MSQADLDLVGLAYEAALDPDLLPAFLAGLTNFMDADVTIWLGADARAQPGPEVAGSGLDATMTRAYNDLGWRSPLAPLILQAPARIALVDRALMPRTEFARSEFYQQWVRPSGLDTALFARLDEPAPDEIVLLNIMRTPSAHFGQFEQLELERLQRLLRHFDKAVRLRSRLKQGGTVRTGPVALDQLRIAVLCLSVQGAIRWANRSGENLLRKADGLSYTAQTGITGANSGATNAIRRLLKHAAAGPGGALRLDRPSGAPALSVIATPHLPDSRQTRIAGVEQPGVLLFINDPCEQAEDQQRDRFKARLQAIYGLTSAQAAIALHIADGEGLPAIAARLALSPATIRSHAKHIFAKTHVHNQAQLARLVERVRLIV